MNSETNRWQGATRPRPQESFKRANMRRKWTSFPQNELLSNTQGKLQVYENTTRRFCGELLRSCRCQCARGVCVSVCASVFSTRACVSVSRVSLSVLPPHHVQSHVARTTTTTSRVPVCSVFVQNNVQIARRGHEPSVSLRNAKPTQSVYHAWQSSSVADGRLSMHFIVCQGSW